jgi:hypothetical protein
MNYVYRILLLGLALLSSLCAADSELEALREMRREIDARRIVREHMTGNRKVSAAELAAAEAVIRRGDEGRARQVAADPDGGFKLVLDRASIGRVGEVLKKIFSTDVTAHPDLDKASISFAVSDQTLDGFRLKIKNELGRNGIFFNYQPDRLILQPRPPETSKKNNR